MYYEERPWGNFKVLYGGKDCKVKKITVNPEQKLSYQYHYKRNEYWTIISGNGKILLNDKIIDVSAGSNIFIPAEAKHTIENISNKDPLVFIEIQTGNYFGEDDIVRLEDRYGRT